MQIFKLPRACILVPSSKQISRTRILPVPRILSQQPKIPRKLHSGGRISAFEKPVRSRRSLHNAAVTTQPSGSSREILILQASSRPRRYLLTASTIILLGLSYFYVTDTRSSIHQYITPPLLRLVYPDAEDAHHAGVSFLQILSSYGLAPRERVAQPQLSTKVFGHDLENPIAISAGLDKDGEIPSELLALGPGIVEIGGITPEPQPGNERPRVWRLPSQNAMINRYGLNSKGAVWVAERLRRRLHEFISREIDCSSADDLREAEELILSGEAGIPPGSLIDGKLLAIQIAKNKSTPDDDIDAVARDYTRCVTLLGPYADILVVNVSSPNTAGLRALQAFEPLAKILSAVTDASRSLPLRKHNPPKVMVKISPDEDSDSQITGICHAIFEAGVNGVIVGNTTKTRPSPDTTHPGLTIQEAASMAEQGGFSGPWTFPQTLSLVKRYRKTLDEASRATGEAERKEIFASGGITSGKDVLDVLEAGASVAMTYTGLTYGGVGFVGGLKREMGEEMRRGNASGK